MNFVSWKHLKSSPDAGGIGNFAGQLGKPMHIDSILFLAIMPS